MLVPCQVCGSTCGKYMFPEDRPSPIFVMYSCLMNCLVFIFAIVGMVTKVDLPPEAEEGDLENTGQPKLWLGVAMAIAAVNLIFACYVHYRFTHLTRGPGAKGAASAAWQLFAYDVGVCMYMCFCIFIIVWIASASSFEGPETVPGDPTYTACKSQNDRMGTVQICLGLYLGLAGVIICCSVVTECGRKPRYMTHVNQQQQQQQGAANYPAPQAAVHQGYPQQMAPVGPPAGPAGGYPPQQQQPQQQQTVAQKAGGALGAGLGKLFGKKK
eukprot:TRINITY_DN16886_c6_g1_i1.p1 TRINITY_DN16886_c6_g1~~TRINITY_DN16886_c6_g1_i1.p1  ORF type:complete len:300 (+),score=84.89 TRINITY_DN16886_c6_g1_i1:93-902(+)